MTLHHAGHEVEEISAEECWKLLAAETIGRLATATVDTEIGDISVDVFPVNFLIHDGAIFFRSGPGSKLMNIAANGSVAFEIDGQSHLANWSVVARGRAHRLSLDRDIEDSGLLALETAHPTEKWNYVRIDVDSVTGIRFRR
jgi:Predicted flavin-nucleotide-binding protein